MKFPGISIIATGDREPGEKQNLKQTVPDFSSGAAQRQIIDMVGNVINFSNFDGKYMCQLLADKKTFAKNKIAKIYTKMEVPQTIDLTNRPEAFWEMVSLFKNEGIETKKAETPISSPDSIKTETPNLDDEKNETKKEPVVEENNIKTPAKAPIKAPAKVATKAPAKVVKK